MVRPMPRILVGLWTAQLASRPRLGGLSMPWRDRSISCIGTNEGSNAESRGMAYPRRLARGCRHYGALFAPIAAIIAGVGFQLKRKERGIDPGLLLFSLAAIVLAIYIYPAHFNAVATCDAIAARANSPLERLLDTPTERRMDTLEAGCNDLPFYEMREY